MEVALFQIRKLLVRNRKPSMPAVVEARTIFCAFPLDTSRGESKAVWISRVSRDLGISTSLGRKIYYRLVTRMDADRLTGMRERYETLNQRITNAKAAEQRAKGHANEIRESLGATVDRGAVDERQASGLRGAVAEDRGVVPRQDR